MYQLHVSRHGWPGEVNLTDSAEGIRWNRYDLTGAIDRLAGVPEIAVSKEQLVEMLGDRPGIGPCPFEILPDYYDADLAAAWTP